MPTYEHFQQAKKAESLPDTEKIGACITCKWWKAETPRPHGMTTQIAPWHPVATAALRTAREWVQRLQQVGRASRSWH